MPVVIVMLKNNYSICFGDIIKSMNYYELKIYTTTAGVEILTALLDEYGITGITVDDPRDLLDLLDKKSCYDWDYVDDELIANASDETIVTFYLEETPYNSNLIQDIYRSIENLKSSPEAAFYYGRLELECHSRSDEEWKDVWKAFFKPLLLVDGLWIKPSWEDFIPANEADIVLELDPGMAFGTGKHETTALCAGLLKNSIRADVCVLDIGCGSGILSIAAALLGAAKVLAVDIDEDAVTVARENVIKNDCESIVQVVCADLTKEIDFKADIVMANLTAELIIELTGLVRKNMNEDAVFIASGILSSKRTLVEKSFNTNGFRIIKEQADGEWHAFLVGKKDKHEQILCGPE